MPEKKSNDNLSQLFGDIRAEHMQKCHPLSIWNYLILLGDGNNNNNRDSELGAVSSRHVRMFPGVGAAGIAPAGTGHTDHLSSNPALPLACFCSTALLMASHKSSWFSPWISTPLTKPPETSAKCTGIWNLPELVCLSSLLTPILKIHGTLTPTLTGCSE